MLDNKAKNMIDKINESIIIYLKKYAGTSMYESMEYSLKSGGKRFRPTLLIATTEAFGGEYKDAIAYAVAIECIHTYSLIHDDLPCMDDDDFRRGVPSCHKKFGEATAVLAGDGLLNLAFEIMIDDVNKKFDIKYVKAMKEIAQASGTKGMIDGQVLDMYAENKNIREDELIRIYENKTGKIICASMLAGAIIGGANKSEIKLIYDASYKLGIAFQIKDDILDVTGDEKKIGKPVNSDTKNNKSTYVAIYGLEKAMTDYKELSNQVLNDITKAGIGDKFIYQYIKGLIDREH